MEGVPPHRLVPGGTTEIVKEIIGPTKLPGPLTNTKLISTAIEHKWPRASSADHLRPIVAAGNARDSEHVAAFTDADNMKSSSEPLDGMSDRSV